VKYDHYTKYNVAHHPFSIRKRGGWFILKDVHAANFRMRRLATPRYNYNQLMYRLDLVDRGCFAGAGL